MTTIAANRESIACDLMVTSTAGYKFKSTSKIVKIAANPKLPFNEDFYVGYAGTIMEVTKMVEYLKNPDTKRPKKVGGSLLILSQSGGIYIVEDPDPATWIKVTSGYAAIGSGMNYAMGALQSGKNPLEAVKIAGKLDPATGLGYKNYSF